MINPTNWRQQLTDLGGYENEMLGVPAGGVRKMIDELEQLRAKRDEVRANFLRCSRLREIEQTAFVSVSKSNELLAAKVAALERQPMTDETAWELWRNIPETSDRDVETIYLVRAVEAHHEITPCETTKIMKTWHVWSEGYLATGDRAYATLEGIVEADTWPEACRKACVEQGRWTEEPGGFDPKQLKVWGCRLFDNEIAARKTFG